MVLILFFQQLHRLVVWVAVVKIQPVEQMEDQAAVGLVLAPVAQEIHPIHHHLKAIMEALGIQTVHPMA
jgi:hypothetical protein